MRPEEHSAHPLLQNYDALLVDLDGTVFAGGTPIDGAAEGLASHSRRGKTMYVTNNASRSPEQVAQLLTDLGFPTEPTDVLTSAMAAVDMAVENVQQRGIEDPRVYVIGAPSFRQLAEQANLGVVDSADDQPHVVLHGHSPDNNWSRLSEGALALQRGAAYIASNLDTTLPTERGFMVGNGSMVAAVTSATGITPQSAGKPGPTMFHNAQDRLHSHRPLAIGDRLDTDIAGGNAAGIDTLCTVTGVSGHWDILRASPAQRPTHIAANMRDHLPDWHAEQSSTVEGKHQIRIHSGADVDSLAATPQDPTAVLAAEALAVAAPFVWALLDSGEELDNITIVGGDETAQRGLDAWR